MTLQRQDIPVHHGVVNEVLESFMSSCSPRAERVYPGAWPERSDRFRRSQKAIRWAEQPGDGGASDIDR